ncbi:hypothetical protein VPH35_063940 [Triticum aestivum]
MMAPAAGKRRKRRLIPRHVPHEVVREILLRLPVRSLLRFRCVSKAWDGTISVDPSFRRDFRLQRKQHPCLLNAVQTALTGRQDTCDSDVVATTGSVLTLPGSQGPTPSPEDSRHVNGIGRNPCTGDYMIDRFFHRFWPYIGNHYLTPHVEVFTIGTDQHWRQTVAQPLRLIMLWQKTIFFQGSFLWTIGQYQQGMTGFLRLRLDSEIFSVLLPPPCWSSLDQKNSTLGELRGELCVACPRQSDDQSLDMWMCTYLDGAGSNLPQWDKRYIIHWDRPQTLLRPVAMLDDGVLVYKAQGNHLCRCILQTRKHVKVKDKFRVKSLKYYNLETDTTVEFPLGSKANFDVISYVPSFVPI